MARFIISLLMFALAVTMATAQTTPPPAPKMVTFCRNLSAVHFALLIATTTNV
ncbi:hypothetical protein HOLleu_23127 [Holothuria leucospilota]|uniref:Uncharacterized protein n=1 Tax=Holothuria leucospilota TaxID=206669 RepID=A0A9Q1H2P1_HOLLE|nr:hypothetical protein HOLleu_23127 [Holothuria leucospilota]